MLELGIGADLLRGVGLLIWLVFGLALLAALIKPKQTAGKVLWSLLVVVLFIGPMIPSAYEKYLFKQRYAKAKTLFDGRCKTAGEKIYRTVENVEGVLLEKVRSKKINFSDQFVLDDPYGRDLGGDGYISSFLRVPTELTGAESQGYLYVDVNDKTGKLIRYQLQRKSSPAGVPYTVISEIQNTGKAANFGVDYTDISTQTDRENWIAGGKLQVTDLNTKQLIAERTGFIFDQGLGNVDGGRGPWEAAISCGKDDRQYGHTARFVMKSIKPVSGK